MKDDTLREHIREQIQLYLGELTNNKGNKTGYMYSIGDIDIKLNNDSTLSYFSKKKLVKQVDVSNSFDQSDLMKLAQKIAKKQGKPLTKKKDWEVQKKK